MFIVGKIVNTHGLKGEVKVKRITDFEERFHVGSTVYIKNKDNEAIPLIIASFRTHKNHDLLQFEEYDSIEAVEPLKGATLYIKKEQLTPLEPGEFYFHEIIGCKMYTLDGEYIGEIESILTPGANDVWVVKNESGKEILIPYIDDVVKEVNIEEKKVLIELMEGLID